VGGIHHRPGRRQRLAYVFLTDDEYQTLIDLQQQGLKITAQDVPTAKAVGLDDLA
jgi:mannose/fructose/N-acetylgalactosamine-specific phosphotransferase system component IIB